MTKITSIADLQSVAKAYNDAKAQYTHHIYTCGGGACISSGCIATRDAVAGIPQRKEPDADVRRHVYGLYGPLRAGTGDDRTAGGTFYVRVTPEPGPGDY